MDHTKIFKRILIQTHDPTLNKTEMSDRPYTGDTGVTPTKDSAI